MYVFMYRIIMNYILKFYNNKNIQFHSGEQIWDSTPPPSDGRWKCIFYVFPVGNKQFNFDGLLS